MEDLRDLLVVGRVVETKEGKKYFVLPDRLISKNSWTNLKDYSRELKGFVSSADIVKIFNAPIKNGLSAWNFGLSGDLGLELVWERKIKKVFSEDEKTIARNFPKEFEYIARDEDKELWLYKEKPEKVEDEWDEEYPISIELFNHLFQQIQWQDDEPTLISDIIN